MNTLRYIVAIFVTTFFGTLSSKAGVKTHFVCGVTAGEELIATRLLNSGNTTTKLMATPAQAATFNKASVGFGIYFTDENNSPITVQSCTITDARYGYYRVYKGVKSDVFYNQPMSYFRHESSPQGGGALFMTGNGMSTVAVSPSSGSFRDVPVANVGAIYLTKMNYHFYLAPPYYRPSKPEEMHVYQFEISFRYTHGGYTVAKKLTFKDLTMSYTVTEVLPAVTLVQPPQIGIPECVEATGEHLHLFKLQWTCDLGGGWQDVPVAPTAHASGCRWTLNALPPSPCRFYRLVQDVQFYPASG